MVGNEAREKRWRRWLVMRRARGSSSWRRGEKRIRFPIQRARKVRGNLPLFASPTPSSQRGGVGRSFSSRCLRRIEGARTRGTGLHAQPLGDPGGDRHGCSLAAISANQEEKMGQQNTSPPTRQTSVRRKRNNVSAQHSLASASFQVPLLRNQRDERAGKWSSAERTQLSRGCRQRMFSLAPIARADACK